MMDEYNGIPSDDPAAAVAADPIQNGKVEVDELTEKTASTVASKPTHGPTEIISANASQPPPATQPPPASQPPPTTQPSQGTPTKSTDEGTVHFAHA